MKSQSYSQTYEIDIVVLKSFLLKIASFYRMNDLAESIWLACDVSELQRDIQNNALYQRRIFAYLKNAIDCEQRFELIEQYLVYMRLLINWNEAYYQVYRRHLLAALQKMCDPYLTADLYCLMRHLIKKGKKYRRQLLHSLPLIDDEMQRYFLCEIYLIEEDYQTAYTYLKGCRYDGVLKQYDFELKSFHALKYRLYALKQPIFKRKKYGDLIWMKKQLRY